MEEIPVEVESLQSIARSTFRRWERLRIPYNLLLLGFTIWFHWPILAAIPLAPLILFFLLMCALGANACFLAGPAVETYMIWLGFRSRWVPVVLFTGGVLISIPLVFLFPLFLHG